jgi:hypothetical protein
MSSINKKYCWDTGDTLGRKKPPRRSKTPTSRAPSLYKASPCHITPRKQEGSHTTRHWLQICLGDADQQVSKSVAHSIPTDTPGIKGITPWTDWPPPCEKNQNQNQNWITNKELKRTCSREGGVLWAHQRRGEGQVAAWTFSKQSLQKYMANKPLPWRRGGKARSWTPHKLSVNKAWKSRWWIVGVWWANAWNRAESSPTKLVSWHNH